MPIQTKIKIFSPMIMPVLSNPEIRNSGRFPKLPLLATLFLILLHAICCASVPPVVKDKVNDVFVPVNYEKQKASFEGYLGERMKINIEKRLLSLSTASILEPYVNRPGKQTWIGEHVGKFLHAAIYAWEYTHDQRLKSKIDSVAKVLISTQLPDGYLGTYSESERWKDWDVWSHKYNLIGLLKYYESTGYEPALAASKKIGDLLNKVFVDEKKDIIKASWHVGMASTSVLEPMVMLYRFTGDKKYLGFCNHILKTWEQENGPKILTSLLSHGSVYKTANGKAYEMLSNLVGLMDLYRITGEASYFTACKNAWNDIKTNRHYITGTTSWAEHFQDDHKLRPDGEVANYGKFEGPGEGCVTVTWLQLNWHFLRLTGETPYAEELERIIYNSLPGAQSPQKASVCYFIPLEGRKRFGEVSHGIMPDVSCCSSSIPRGMGMIPWLTAGAVGSKPALLQYIPGTYSFNLKNKKQSELLNLKVSTSYPLDGNITIAFETGCSSPTTLLLRVPEWCSSFKATAGGESFTGESGKYLTIERTWKAGDIINIELSLDLRTISNPDKNLNQTIIQRGPQVLATDDRIDTLDKLPSDWIGNQFYFVQGKENGKDRVLRMVPFAEAGQTGGHYEVVQDKLEEVKYK